MLCRPRKRRSMDLGMMPNCYWSERKGSGPPLYCDLKLAPIFI